jgi:hypothetical protein
MVKEEQETDAERERELDRLQWLLEVALFKMVHEDQWDRDERQTALERAAKQRAGARV